MRLLSICLAGAIGTGARYLVGVWAAERLGPGFPYGTLIVNITGCFLIAAVMQVATVSAWSPEWRMAVTVGFLGGFTTYSSFNFETMEMLLHAPGLAVTYVAVTTVSGLAAGWLGLYVARQLTGA